MLLEDDQALVATLGQVPAPPGGEAPLSSLVGRTVTWDEAGDAVARAFAAWTGGPAVPLEGQAVAALAASAAAHEARFRSAEWTWRR
jgi:hypothetical protein